MLAATSSSKSFDPFVELYSEVSGRAESDSMVVRVLFPMAREPANQALDLNIRKDATVEEVFGFVLFAHWEDGWLRNIGEGLSEKEDPKWPIRFLAVGWVMRIAEEDGRPDEDFPHMSFQLYSLIACPLTAIHSTGPDWQNLQVQS